MSFIHILSVCFCSFDTRPSNMRLLAVSWNFFSLHFSTEHEKKAFGFIQNPAIVSRNSLVLRSLFSWQVYRIVLYRSVLVFILPNKLNIMFVIRHLVFPVVLQ